MKNCLLGLIGAALLGGTSLLREVPVADAACLFAACHGKTGADAGDHCCPHCGCGLVQTCQVYCTTKTETKYIYCCKCETICLPPLQPLCPKENVCPDGDRHGHKGCEKGCFVRDVTRLMKYPATREVPVRQCRLVWVCPHCGPGDADGPTALPPVMPAAPAPDNPPPLPPPPRTQLHP